MKGDQMGILAAYPTQRELPLSNWTWFSPPRAGFSFAGVAQLKAEVFKGKFAGWF
jgi:hypothetical protein